MRNSRWISTRRAISRAASASATSSGPPWTRTSLPPTSTTGAARRTLLAGSLRGRFLRRRLCSCPLCRRPLLGCRPLRLWRNNEALHSGFVHVVGIHSTQFLTDQLGDLATLQGDQSFRLARHGVGGEQSVRAGDRDVTGCGTEADGGDSRAVTHSPGDLQV